MHFFLVLLIPHLQGLQAYFSVLEACCSLIFTVFYGKDSSLQGIYGEHMLEKDLYKAKSLDLTGRRALLKKHLQMLFQWVTFQRGWEDNIRI